MRLAWELKVSKVVAARSEELTTNLSGVTSWQSSSVRE